MTRETAEIQMQLESTSDPLERAGLLNELAGKLYETDPKRALELAEEACDLAAIHNEFTAHARSLLLGAMCTNALCDFAASEGFGRRLLDLCREKGERINEANALTAIGIARRGKSDYTGALEWFNEAQQIYLERDDNSRAAAGYNNIGVVHTMIGNLGESLEAYLMALRLYEEGEDEAPVAITSSNIAAIYYYLGDNERSFEYHVRSLDVYRRLRLDQNIALALGNISSFYKDRGDIEQASAMLLEALEIFERIGDRRYEGTTRIRLGILYDLQEKWDDAHDQLTRAVEITTEINNLENVSYAEHRLGEHFIRLGRPDLALPPLNRGLEIAIELGLMKPAAELHESLATAYHAAGDDAGAYRHLLECAKLKEKIFGEERQRAVAEMQARFDIERVEKEREIFRLKSENLEQTMVQRSKELATLAMHLVQKNTFLEKLRKDMGKLAEAFPDSKKACADLMHAITGNLHDDNEWARFEREFQLVHHDFLQMLAQRYPTLTPTEMKVAALLKISLSNKEIMRLLSVSLRNVESHRYSIRKKLGLGSEVNLSTWLARM